MVSVLTLIMATKDRRKMIRSRRTFRELAAAFSRHPRSRPASDPEIECHQSKGLALAHASAGQSGWNAATTTLALIVERLRELP